MADVSMDTVHIEIESTMKDSTSSIDTLITKLNNLKTSISNVVKESQKLTEFRNNIKSASSIPNIKTSGGSSKGRTPAAPKAPFAEYGSLQSQLKALDVNLDTSTAVSSIKTLNSEITKYKTNTGQLVTVNKKVKNGLEGVKVSVRDLNKEVDKGNDSWNVFTKGLTGVITKAGLLYTGIKSIVGKLGDFVDNAATYEEALNLFSVTMGEYAKEGIAWIERFSNALFLDPTNVMQYMGSFNSLIKGLGVGSRNAYLMSQNLTQLVYDLASFKNLSFEESFLKIQSAISGEIEPLRNVGVALSQNTLQELANELGIKKRVAEMSEAEKAQLRYIQILKSTSDWQTDMGRTLLTPANALRVLKEQFTLLAKAVGQVLIPILMKALPFVMAVTQALTDLAKKLANALGYEITDVDYTRTFDSMITGIGDVGDEASKTAKKLNTMLAPFDELNVVQNKSKSASAGVGSVGGDLGVDLPMYDALANLTKEFAKGVDEAKQKLKDMLPIIATVTAALVTMWSINKIAVFVNSLMTIGKAFKGISTVITTIKSLPIFASLSEAVSGIALGISSWINGTATFSEAISFIAPYLATFAQVIGGIAAVILGISRTISGIKKLIEGDTFKGILRVIEGIALVVTGIAILLGGWVVAIVAGVVAAVAYVIEYWEQIKVFFADLWANITEGFSNFWNGIVEIFSVVGNWFNDNVIKPIKNFFSPLIEWFTKLFKSIAQTASDIWYNITGIISGVVEVIQLVWGVVATWFDENVIQPVKNFFEPMWEGLITGAKAAWEGIKRVFSTVANFFKTTFEKAWSGVKTIFSIGGKIFDGIKEGITEAFKTIVNAIIKGINKVIAIPFKGINSALTKIRDINILGVEPFKDKIKPISIPEIPTFATGGYPDSGDLFFANENGIPEMVGRIGNQTAVANNDQIETSLTNALLYALDKSGSGRNNPSRIVVNIGNRKVYEGVGEHIDGENDRYGTDYVKV